MGDRLWPAMGLMALSSALGACSSSHSAPLPPDTTAPSAAPSRAPSPSAAPHPTTATPSAIPSADPAKELADAIAAARGCTDPRARIQMPPAEAKVFNNALTRKDAGNVDRMQGIVDTFFGASTALACCIDAHGGDVQGEDATVFVVWEVSAEGSASAVRTDPERSSVGSPIVDGCLAEVIEDLSFPESPAGKATTVEIPLLARWDSTEPASDGEVTTPEAP